MPDVDVVTGAFGYTGRYITGRLLESGRNVKTLTGHPDRANPFGARIAECWLLPGDQAVFDEVWA